MRKSKIYISPARFRVQSLLASALARRAATRDADLRAKLSQLIVKLASTRKPTIELTPTDDLFKAIFGDLLA